MRPPVVTARLYYVVSALSSDSCPASYWGNVGLVGDIIEATIDGSDHPSTWPLTDIIDCLETAFRHLSRDQSAAAPHRAAALLYSFLWCHRAYKRATEAAVSAREFRTIEARVSLLLTTIDPHWTPGTLLNTRLLEPPSRRLRPVPPHKQSVELELALDYVRRRSVDVANHTRAYPRSTLHTGLDYSISSWLMARKRRLAYSSKRDGQSRDRQWLSEVDRLRKSIELARQAGQDFEAARLGHILFTSLPRGLDEDLDLTRWLRSMRLSQSVKQLGLSIPAKYDSYNALTLELPALSELSVSTHTTPSRADGFLGIIYRRIASHVDRNPDIWHPISTLFESPPAPDKLYMPYEISRDLAKRFPPGSIPITVAGAAFRIALDFGYLNFASALLERHRLGRHQLVDFAQTVKRALQSIVFGVDMNKVARWREIIHCSMERLLRFNTFTPAEVLMLHEVCQGRLRLAQLRMTPALASRLYEHKQGLLSEGESERIYEHKAAFQLRSPATATLANISGCLARAGDSKAATVAMSVMLLPHDGVSILGVSKEGWFASYCLRIDGLQDALAAVLHRRSDWFLHENWSDAAPSIERYQVGWRSPIMGLFAKVRATARELDRKCRFIVLSVDPELLDLPINHGLNSVREEGSGGVMCAALVPSLSWFAAMSSRSTDTPGQSGVYCSSRVYTGDTNDPVVGWVAESTRMSRARVTGESKSLTTVIAHGFREPRNALSRDGLPEVGVEAGTWSAADDWDQALRTQHVILHSCHSGASERDDFGEVGKLPGLAFSRGVRAMVAPVQEISGTVAATLDKELYCARPIFGGYLAAIRKDARISLYNIYGIGSDSIII